MGLDPFQGALFPDPDISHDQDQQEDQHFDQAEYAQRFELNRPGEEENGLHVEDHEKDGDDVIAHGVASAGGVYRIDAALVGHQFGLAGIVRPHQLGRQERDGNQDAYESDKDEYGNVVLRHRTPLANLPAGLSPNTTADFLHLQDTCFKGNGSVSLTHRS